MDLEAQAAFKGLKQTFTSASILIHPDPAWPFLVETVVSGCVIGAVLA